jgi:molybdopterin converting factor small subunit
MTTENTPSRREALKGIALLSLGAVVAFVGGSELVNLSLRRSNIGKRDSKKSQSQQSDSSNTAISSSPLPVAGSSSSTSAASNLETIKVGYFGMSVQTIGISREYFIMPAPVHLEDLLDEIDKRHPVISAMLPSMQILVNGVPADSSTELTDASEVDLIPIFAGG